jgi:hypothetical protein
MIEELRRRNFAESTIRSYVHGVEHFSRHFHRRPDQLGPQHIRQYQAMLFTKLKFSPNTVIQRLGALRFFYIKVLEKNWSIAETPYPRKVIHLPEILSPEEVARLIDAAELPLYRILLMTLYGTGARRAEVAHLMRCAIIGAGFDASPQSGSFPATDGTRGTVPSQPRSSGMPASMRRNAPGLFTGTSIPTLCDIVSRRICWRQALTCAPSRCCSDIAILRRRLSICTCPSGTSAQQPALSMPSRSLHKEDTSTVHEPASAGDGRHCSLCWTRIR